MAGANEVYAIDIQAALPEGDSVSAKLDALTKSINGAEQSAGFLSAAVDQVGAALTAAKAATADADAALAEGNAQWAELEANANRAAKALERASAKGAVPDDVAAQATAARVALDAYAIKLGGLENAAADARTSEQALALSLAATKDAAKAAGAAEADAAKAAADAAKQEADAAKAPLLASKQRAEELEKLRGSLASLPGPLGKVASAALAPAQGFEKLSGSMGQASAAQVLFAAGSATVVVAIAAIIAALVVGLVKISAWAIGLSDATRSAGLASEAFAALNPELAGLDFAGVAKETQLSDAALQGLALSLQKAGVAAGGMNDALRTAALLQRASGPEAAQQYVALEQAATDAQKAVDEAAKSGGTASAAQVEALRKARAAAEDFAAMAQTKLGGIVARQLLSLDAQSERFKANIGGLFGSLNIEPALQGLATLVALFDKNTAAGEALQFLFQSVFQPLIDNAQVAAQVVEAFYLGVLIGALKLYLALKPTIKAVEEFFGLDGSGLSADFELITKAGEAVAVVLAVIGAAVLAVIGVVALFVAGLASIPAGIIYVVKSLADFIAQAAVFAAKLTSDVIDAVVGFVPRLIDAGAQLVAGLAQGIASGAAAVVSSITNVVGGAISAAKSALGIASPSKVFAEIGDHTAQGFAGGVEDSTDAAHQAMATMVSPAAALDNAALSGDVGTVQKLSGVDAAAAPAPAATPADGAPATASGGGGKPTIHVEQMTINASDRAGGQEAADAFLERVTEWLEGDAAQAAGAF